MTTSLQNLGRIVLLALTLGFTDAVAKAPNIVFIFDDDMGYDDVQILNPERAVSWIQS
ncbi:hypothetical protein SH580_01665 [Coraliomargarita algicola]|uniref:Sulfatase N-terminal domain-containing protein n=1 Tax=Coraliomargarita algicola TaxID=3092156 RepID=A0ABZ0RLT7_9BACT|nr:hypothetical protein [Coraliomargarita sp. J2-16]WPJ96408.1 hypothetical protein SH580_01665 [Coraliomargarita sp. J2-16]